MRQPQRDMTREELIVQGRKATMELVSNALDGCGDPAHRTIEAAAQEIVKGSFLLDVLPAAIRDAVVKFYVFDALHHNVMPDGGPLAAIMGDAKPDLSKLFARLGDHERVLLCMNIATLVLKVLGRSLDDESLDRDPLAGIKLSTGVYA